MPQTIAVKEETLRAVDKSTYLGSILSRSVNIDAKVNLSIAKASTAFGRLRETVWERRGSRLTTKLKVYKAVVLSSLLYACKTWTVCERQAKQRNRYHLNCRIKLLKNTWRDRVLMTLKSSLELACPVSTLCSREPRSSGLVTLSEYPTHASQKTDLW